MRQDRYLVQYAVDGQTRIDEQQGANGIGDLELSAGFRLREDFAFRALAKLPTGRGSRLQGGNAGGALWFDFDPFHGAANWFGYVSAGASYSGQSDVIGDQQKQFVGLAGAAIGYRIWRPVSLLVQFNGHTALHQDSGLNALDRPGGAMFAVAPLFHITGLIGHVAAPLLAGAPTILTCRFHPIVAAESISEHRATAIIGAITVFIAWTDSAAVSKESLSSLESVYSGGAPIPHAALEAFRAKFGHYIHNGYGLTETNSPAIVVPNSREAPVDPASGAVAVGVPVSNTYAEVVDENDKPVQVGEYGEIVVSGPQVALGYWNKPDETAHAMPDGRFHTGDIGFMDGDGWFYIVDRMKDQINASGFKVWPREVEDVLYEHPAVREAAVVGVMDPYRGETVKAFVSFKDGAEATTEDLVEFCKERLAAYKYPRIVEVMNDLPKTVSGKILRRELRVPN